MSDEIKPNNTLDERGEVCPIPDVDTRRKLKEMKSGEVVEVLIVHFLRKGSQKVLKKLVEKLFLLKKSGEANGESLLKKFKGGIRWTQDYKVFWLVFFSV